MSNLCSDPRWIIFNSSKQSSNHFLSRASCFARSINFASAETLIDWGIWGIIYACGGFYWFHKKSYSFEFSFYSSTSCWMLWLNYPNLFKRDTKRKNSEDFKDFSWFTIALTSSFISTILPFKVVRIALWLWRNSAIFSLTTTLQSF